MAREIRVALVLDDSNFRRGIRSAKAELQGLEQQGKKTGDTIKSDLMDKLSAIGFIAAGAAVLKLVNDFQSLQNKLIAVTGSQAGASEAFTNIKNIAEATRSPISAIGDLYSKLAIATKEAGASAKDVSGLTTTFAQTLQLSGTTGQQAAAAILQFGQAMASGKLAGDEFRAMMEYNPVLMMKIANAIELPIGKLKQLASEGALTAKAIEYSMKAIAPEIQTEFDRMQTTVSQSFTLIGNNFVELIANIESKFGVFSGLANLIKSLSENVQVFGGILAAAFGAGVARLIYGIVSALILYRAQVIKTTFAQATLLALGGPAGLAALAAGVIAAGVAYSQLSDLMDENTAKSEAKAKADEAAFKAKTEEAKKYGELAKQEIARGKAEEDAKKAAEKAAKKAEQEAEARRRAAARNLQSIKENIAQLQVETTAMGEKLALDLRLVGTAEDYAEKEQKILDINKQRDKALADIKAKELSTDPVKNALEKAKAEAQVNDEYNKQIKSLDELIAIRIKQTQVDSARNVAAIGREGANAVAAINDEIAARNYLFDYEKNYALKTAQIKRKAADDEAVLREQSLGMDKKLFDEKLAAIIATRDAELKSANEVSAAQQKKTELSRTWAEGIAEAQRTALLRLTDEAAYAQTIFNTAMDGFTNSILKFVETGKLSFNDLFKSLMTEIIKMQASKLFMSFFGGGGVFGSLFPGLNKFLPTPGKAATGGVINRPTIVGENGAELFVPLGTGSVIPNNRLGGGTTQVVYNINAVDAMSFKQLVARDPEFIYSVTQAGARRLPR
jgi:lambda family phage tail tape measure protein